MPVPTAPLRKLGFLTIGLFDGDDPGPGHRSLLEIIELGERLGFDSAWLRHRHLQYGVSSPIAILAAASQRTIRPEPRTTARDRGAENTADGQAMTSVSAPSPSTCAPVL